MKILNLYGIKGVMETYYNEEKGEFIPVTNLKILDNHYLYSSPDHRDIVTIMRSCRLSKSVQGTLNKYSNSTLNGFKLRSLDDSYTRSNTDRLELLTQSNILSVTAKGISKGKGFQGCMKRYNFKGLGQTHGVHTAHRSRGGIASKGSQV